MRVTERLVVANVAVFVAMILLGIHAEALYASRGLVPARFLSGFGLNGQGLAEMGTIFSSMFLHA